MTKENRKEINELNERFTKLHSELLELKMWDIAKELSAIYHKSSSANYSAGIKFMENLYNN